MEPAEVASQRKGDAVSKFGDMTIGDCLQRLQGKGPYTATSLGNGTFVMQGPEQREVFITIEAAERAAEIANRAYVAGIAARATPAMERC